MRTHKLKICSAVSYWVNQISARYNVSRAQLIDQDALIDGFNSDHISSYAADVYISEPNLKADPLITNANMLGTPHTAGSTRDTYEAAIHACLDNIERCFSGEKLKHLVSRGMN